MHPLGYYITEFCLRANQQNHLESPLYRWNLQDASSSLHVWLEMDGRRSTLLFLIIIHIISACLSCPEHQQAFGSSCYEFVALERSFLSAQGWCERGGGHLAFIQRDETQQFLQKHLQPEQDWWIGLVSTSINRTLDKEGTRLLWKLEILF